MKKFITPPSYVSKISMLFFASVLSSTALATDITGVQQVTSIAKDWNMIGND